MCPPKLTAPGFYLRRRLMKSTGFSVPCLKIGGKAIPANLPPGQPVAVDMFQPRPFNPNPDSEHNTCPD